MNISTVAENLKRTIAGKEQKLTEWKSVKSTLHPMMYQTLVPMLELNIDELKRILQEVEQCAKQASDDSWITNPDRMGGQFTQDEIDNASKW